MRILKHVAWLCLAALVVALGCDEGYKGEHRPNVPPQTFLSSGPPAGTPNTNYRVHFYWYGYDPDGKIDHFEFLITDDYVIGDSVVNALIIDENIDETLAALGYRWTETATNDSVFVVTADSIPGDPIGNPDDAIYYYSDDYTDGRFLFRAQHTFFLRAVDEDDQPDPTPTHITFTATTIAPEVNIIRPADLGAAGGYETLPTDIFFSWLGADSTGSGEIINPDSTRFTVLERGTFGLDTQSTGRMLNFPEEVWSIWRGWEDEDSLLRVGGNHALVQDLISSSQGGGRGYYLFFVQAKDEAGAITTHFTDGRNLKKIRVLETIRPRLLVRERTLGVRQSNFSTAFDFTIAENQPLELRWSGSADHYGSEITGYRYGWDLTDVSDDSQWSSWSITNTSTTGQFASGDHTFYVEARDYSNNTTRIVYRFAVIPFTMEFELLFIDDYDNSNLWNTGWPLGSDAYAWQVLRHSDQDMKNFWDNQMLYDYSDYNPVRDFYRVRSGKPPFEIVANYRRILWEVREGSRTTGLSEVARFVDTYLSQSVPYDYLSAFMDRGGQLFLCGATPISATLPYEEEMYNEYIRSSPMAFLRYLQYSQGSQVENAQAQQNYLPWRQFGIDVLAKPVNGYPITGYPNTGADWKTTYRQVYGMVAAEYLADIDNFGISGAEIPLRVEFKDSVYLWFNAVGRRNPYIDQDGVRHESFGLNEAEVYNWDWFRYVFNPPVDYRTSKYMPLLAYIPADDTCRWGTHPASIHYVTTDAGVPYNEMRYSTGGGAKHVIALVGLEHPESPSVVMSIPPYYIKRTHAKPLIDHILVDIMGMQK